MILNTRKVSLALVLSALLATAFGCGGPVAQSSPSASAEFSATPAASPTPDLFQGSLADLRAAVTKIHDEDVAGELAWCGVKGARLNSEDCEFTDAGVSESVRAYPVVTFTWGYTRAKFDFSCAQMCGDTRDALWVKKVTCSYRLSEAGYSFTSGNYTRIISGQGSLDINGTDVYALVNGSYDEDYGSSPVYTYVECPPSK